MAIDSAETTAGAGPAPGELVVFGLEEPDELGWFINRGEARYERRAIPLERLSAQFTDFVDKMGHVLSGLPATMAEFAVQEVTFTAQVSGKGTVNLLGTGGEIAAGGGVTVKLVRAAAGRAPEEPAGTVIAD